MLKQLIRKIGTKRLVTVLALAAILGGFAAVELAEAQIGGFCRICRVTDPCTGTVYTASGCCALPKKPHCISSVTPAGCIGGVAVVCL